MRHLLLSALIFLAVPGVAAAELVRSFDAEYEVRPNGQVEVTETILYNFETAKRHGIYRTLELQHPQSAEQWYEERIIEVNDIAVRLNGQRVPTEVTESGDVVDIRIGDPNKTITGVQTYTINYTLSGAFSYYDNALPEFYWNVTGDGWDVRMQSVTAEVTPAELFAEERACYQGKAGSNEKCDDISAATTSVVFKSNQLAPGGQLTIAQSFDSEAVARLATTTMKWYLFVIPLGALLLITGGWWVYRVRTKHKIDRPVIAQYEPYPEVLPMYTGLLVDGRLDAKDISAGIIYLAEQGVIKIKKTSRKILWLFDTDDYEIEVIDPSAIPSDHLSTVVELLFDRLEAGGTVTLSDLAGDRTKQRQNHKRLQSLKKSLKQDLIERGFYERFFKLSIAKGVFAGVALVIGFVLTSLFDVVGDIVLVVGILCVVAVLVVLHRRRTKKGYEARNHILGFKDFLSTTDKERFAFHNAPERNPETFMEYLPYAVALGVEEEWAKVFDDITIPQPGWYDSGTAGGYFSATALTKDLDAFSSSFSSSSGSSGSSGGGSAGGGAGGGGGGSW